MPYDEKPPPIPRETAPGARARARFWRSIAQAEGRVDPAHAASPAFPGHDRRDFMKLMAASLALGGIGGCSRAPLEKIVPYRDGPAQQTYGKPVYYASALPRHGYGVGVLVETNMGRPTKIEGNPAHPASLGATGAFEQADVLGLWDPDRSQAIRHERTISTWNAFLGALEERLAANGGARLRILTETIASPSLHALLASMLARHPSVTWHQWQPLNDDNVHDGAALAFGRPLDTLYRFDRAHTVVALDGDFLDEAPGCVRHALDFAAVRNAHAPADARSRLYALESMPTLTGAAADHRLALRASEIALAAQQLAHALGALPAPAARNVVPDAWMRAMLADLRADMGRSIVTCGRRQPPHVHALVHLVNAHLHNVGRTIEYIEPVALVPENQLASLRALVDAMRAGEVDAIAIVGSNPVYTAPADFDFAGALAKVPFKVHHGLYVDETARRCDFHIPATHPLEQWGDLRAFDGTLALQQPCIAPLYEGRSAHEVIAALAGDVAHGNRALVDAYWRSLHGADHEAFVEASLRSGVVADSRPASVSPAPSLGAIATAALAAARASASRDEAAANDIELAFFADPRMLDGRYANNAWLQELPQPLTQLTWDNAACISPSLARALGVADEDVVEIRAGGRRVAAPVWTVPGMPARSVALALGHGRSAAGRVGNGRGVNAYAIRGGDAPWIVAGVSIARTGRTHPLACAQTHHSMEGRDILHVYTLDEAQACTKEACGTPHYREARTLYATPPTGPYAWAMSVDLTACIGCGACTIACQAENNIPVVGAAGVRNGREMHWIRVDRYFEGEVDAARALFQPVPCMQCEHAPCEVVCPVEASVHDAQGINVQVYNRCVGTRFCSNNCPYKVRRFNFLQYADDVPGLDAQRNPEVTVRMRGVMEKCNYCLQRITTAKIAADAEGRRVRDGEVVTACQAACPTRAIVFGDLADPDSAVNRRKDSPLDYALLVELNTRPRTTYLGRVTNPSPLLAQGREVPSSRAAREREGTPRARPPLSAPPPHDDR